MTTDDKDLGAPDVPADHEDGIGGTSGPDPQTITVPMEIPLVDGRIELALSAALIVFGGMTIALSQTIRPGSIPDPIGSDGFPILAGSFLIIVGGVQSIRQIRSLRVAKDHMVPCPGADTDEPGYRASTVRAFAMFAVGFAWALTLPVLGFLPATSGIGIASITMMGVRSWTKQVLVPVITALVMWLVFDQVFGIQIPNGPVETFLDDLLPSIRI